MSGNFMLDRVRRF